MLLPVTILGILALTARSVGPLFALIPLLVIFPLFGWLTVEVSDLAVSVRFGVGLIRRTIPLQDIVSISPVETSWLQGWGIRFIPGGRLYNVSGNRAVELALSNGAKVWIGTDDPDGLRAALGETAAETAVLAGIPAAPSDYTTLGIVITVAVVMIAVWALVIRSMGSIEVTASASTVAVHGAGYTATVATRDIVSVHLDTRLPPISWRTNGFAFGGRLRGHFKLSDGRAALLFVTERRPPYITVETRKEPLIFNFEEPQRTRALYQQLSAGF